MRPSETSAAGLIESDISLGRHLFSYLNVGHKSPFKYVHNLPITELCYFS